MKNIFCSFALGLALSGCAYHAQKATVAPSLSIAASAIGEGTTVALRVVDERPSMSIGRRGNGMMQAADISSDQDMAEVFRQAIADGLTAQGFKVVAPKAAETTLTVELRSLEYKTVTGFWVGHVNVQASLKSIAKRPGADEFERMYRTDKSRNVMIVPTAGKNETQINQAASQLLGEMFADGQLTSYLAGK